MPYPPSLRPRQDEESTGDVKEELQSSSLLKCRSFRGKISQFWIFVSCRKVQALKSVWQARRRAKVQMIRAQLQLRARGEVC